MINRKPESDNFMITWLALVSYFTCTRGSFPFILIIYGKYVYPDCLCHPNLAKNNINNLFFPQKICICTVVCSDEQTVWANSQTCKGCWGHYTRQKLKIDLSASAAVSSLTLKGSALQFPVASRLFEHSELHLQERTRAHTQYVPAVSHWLQNPWPL